MSSSRPNRKTMGVSSIPIPRRNTNGSMEIKKITNDNSMSPDFMRLKADSEASLSSFTPTTGSKFTNSVLQSSSDLRDLVTPILKKTRPISSSSPSLSQYDVGNTKQHNQEHKT